MKKHLVSEKNEIVNISKSEPHVESYVNDELWNKHPKNQLIRRISDFSPARIYPAVDKDF